MNAIKTTFDKIVKIEEKNSLLSKTFLGIHYWELLRQGILLHNLKRNGTYGSVQKREREPTTVPRKVKRHKISKNTAIFVHSSNRRVSKDGTFIDAYTHILHEYFNDIVVRIEGTRIEDMYTNSIVLAGIFTPYVSYTLRIILYMSIRLRQRYKSLIILLDKEDLFFRGGYHNFIRNFSNYIINFSKTLILASFYRPKLAVFICSYGKESHIHAYKKLGIPTIELQHGIITRFHAGYNYPLEPKNIFPDYFFLWGDGWHNNISFPIKDDCIKIIGYYLQEIKPDKDELRSIDCCIISQPYFNDELVQYANNYQQANPSEVVFFRLHPNDFADHLKYKSLLDSRITISNDGPINEILMASYKAVGVSSTSMFECLIHKVEVYLLKIPGVEYMMDFVNRGIFAEIDLDQYSLNGACTNKASDDLFRKELSLIEEIQHFIE